METLAEHSSAPSSFRSLLASLAGPKGSEAAFDDSDLAPDVASLSYESALRAHARYRIPDPIPSSTGQGVRSVSVLSSPAADFSPALPQTAANDPLHRPSPTPCQGSPAWDRILKTSSVTIRLSAEESAQLRRRAAEAGLTLSAYLRSCTFEVESLRAQVKQALAELRSTPDAPEMPAKARRGKSLFAWLGRILLRWPAHRAAHA
jgi:hypothetical protein